MSERPRRFTGRQLTTMFVVGCTAAVLMPVAASAAPGAFSITDSTGRYHAAVNQYGQLIIAGPVSFAPKQSVAVNNTVPTTSANTTVVLFDKHICTTTTQTDTINLAGYSQIRYVVRNFDMSQHTWELYELVNDGTNSWSDQVAGEILPAGAPVSKVVDVPAAGNVRIDCLGVAVPGGVGVLITGRR